MNEKTIQARLEGNAIPFSPDLPARLETYLDLLQRWNEKMDLTAVEGEEELLDRHFLDSLTVLTAPLLPDAAKLIDVGTGAGFPGLALALARPDLRVTLLDSQRKRLSFLETVIRETGAENVTLVHARAEDAARQPALREQFDIACARAVAPLPVLSELLLPFVRVGGRMLCWKGPSLTEEMESGRRAAFLLGGRMEPPVPCPLADREWDHRILPVKKEKPTPKMYPRKAGIPKKAPLGT